ncbi:MAG TPA: cytochrome c3 family protein [Longimicrobiaceae bacterium]|nr:cytochrome c3 family protein [Longimicrobiaceae bacterium]
MKRVLSSIGLALLAVAAGSCGGYSASEDDGPDQPIAFYHSVHAGENQIPCAYCHYSADRSVDAGIPAVQVCVGCHVPGSGAAGAVPAQAVLAFPTQQRNAQWNAEATRLVDFWKRGEAIPWVRIHKLPEHAKFPHFMHVNAGLQCQTCHGPVQEMEKVYQFSSLRMGWCIDCHRGTQELSPQEDTIVRQRSSFIRRVAALRAAGDDTRGQPATWPNQRASTDCVVCHY